jgi:hypothetical protein
LCPIIADGLQLADAEWRQLFITLNLEITTKGTPETTPILQDRPKKLLDFDLWDYVLVTDKVEATISFPLQPETLENIVFTEPGGFAPSHILSPSRIDLLVISINHADLRGGKRG